MFDESKSKLSVLQEILDLMDEQSSGRLASKARKRPVAVDIAVTSGGAGKPEGEGTDLDRRLAEKARGLAADGDDTCESGDDEELKERLMDMYSKLK